MLGSRGPIVKLYIADFPLYLSGEDCISSVERSPQQYLPRRPHRPPAGNPPAIRQPGRKGRIPDLREPPLHRQAGDGTENCKVRGLVHFSARNRILAKAWPKTWTCPLCVRTLQFSWGDWPWVRAAELARKSKGCLPVGPHPSPNTVQIVINGLMMMCYWADDCRGAFTPLPGEAGIRPGVHARFGSPRNVCRLSGSFTSLLVRR